MLQQIIHSAQFFLPETVLTIAFCTAIVADLMFSRSRSITVWIVMLGLVITAIYVSKQAVMGTNSVFNNMFAVDPFSIFFKMIVLTSAFFIVLFSMQSKELNNGTRKLGEYYAFLLAMTLGMFLMTGASNLLMMYLSLELTSISSY